MTAVQPNPETAKADGLFRLVNVATRRFSREPATRELSARMLLTAAVALYSDQTSPGEAALIAAEAVAELARIQRLGDK